ncbi:hypothetical protein IAT38_002524 [Cryptococcus sp. DSM 104549]
MTIAAEPTPPPTSSPARPSPESDKTPQSGRLATEALRREKILELENARLQLALIHAKTELESKYKLAHSAYESVDSGLQYAQKLAEERKQLDVEMAGLRWQVTHYSGENKKLIVEKFALQTSGREVKGELDHALAENGWLKIEKARLETRLSVEGKRADKAEKNAELLKRLLAALQARSLANNPPKAAAAASAKVDGADGGRGARGGSGEMGPNKRARVSYSPKLESRR